MFFQKNYVFFRFIIKIDKFLAPKPCAGSPRRTVCEKSFQIIYSESVYKCRKIWYTVTIYIYAI